MTESSPRSSSAGGARQENKTGSDVEPLVALVQHQLNNPLAALLAEVQLLGMESDLRDDHRAAVERITDLVRRVIILVRDLDERIISGSPR